MVVFSVNPEETYASFRALGAADMWNMACVVGNLSHSLEVIDLKAGRAIASDPVGVRPYNCAITADEKIAQLAESLQAFLKRGGNGQH